MKIIKHGTPKDCLHFICDECGCEWLATKEETYKTPDTFLVEEDDGYVMTCPDCHNAFGHTIKSHGRLIDANDLLDGFMLAYPIGSYELSIANELIECAETIIEAED